LRPTNGSLHHRRRASLISFFAQVFRRFPKTITQQKAGILAAITNGLSNARVEAINTQIRLITRRAFGFHTPEALIALAMLSLAGLCPPLPDR
jgi:transposase